MVVYTSAAAVAQRLLFEKQVIGADRHAGLFIDFLDHCLSRRLALFEMTRRNDVASAWIERSAQQEIAVLTFDDRANGKVQKLAKRNRRILATVEQPQDFRIKDESSVPDVATASSRTADELAGSPVCAANILATVRAKGQAALHFPLPIAIANNRLDRLQNMLPAVGWIQRLHDQQLLLLFSIVTAHALFITPGSIGDDRCRLHRIAQANQRITETGVAVELFDFNF